MGSEELEIQPAPDATPQITMPDLRGMPMDQVKVLVERMLATAGGAASQIQWGTFDGTTFAPVEVEQPETRRCAYQLPKAGMQGAEIELAHDPDVPDGEPAADVIMAGFTDCNARQVVAALRAVMMHTEQPHEIRVVDGGGQPFTGDLGPMVVGDTQPGPGAAPGGDGDITISVTIGPDRSGDGAGLTS